jgi:hypothetical protein
MITCDGRQRMFLPEESMHGQPIFLSEELMNVQCIFLPADG